MDPQQKNSNYDRELVIELAEAMAIRDSFFNVCSPTFNYCYMRLLNMLVNGGVDMNGTTELLRFGRRSLMGRFLRTHFPEDHRIYRYVRVNSR